MARKLSPGPIATAEQVRKADAEALELLKTIIPLNLSGASRYIRRHPPSPEAIATLGWKTYEVLQSLAGQHRNENSCAFRVEKHDLRSIDNVREKHPALLKDYRLPTVNSAISRYRKRLGLAARKQKHEADTKEERIQQILQSHWNLPKRLRQV